MKITLSVFIFLLTFLVSQTAIADSILGNCYNRSGEPCGKIHRISTSWNSNTAYPENGKYSLFLGDSVDSRITVYCDGSTAGTVNVKGDTRFDLQCD